jgi:hypothetical protein
MGSDVAPGNGGDEKDNGENLGHPDARKHGNTTYLGSLRLKPPIL